MVLLPHKLKGNAGRERYGLIYCMPAKADYLPVKYDSFQYAGVYE